MIADYLLPVADVALAHIQLMHMQSLGNTLRIHSDQKGFPNLDGVQIAIIGLRENRRDPNTLGESLSFTEIRRAFYELFPGNWHTTIADLGDIDRGESVEDTYFAIKEVTEALVKKNIIPIYLSLIHISEPTRPY